MTDSRKDHLALAEHHHNEADHYYGLWSDPKLKNQDLWKTAIYHRKCAQYHATMAVALGTSGYAE